VEQAIAQHLAEAQFPGIHLASAISADGVNGPDVRHQFINSPGFRGYGPYNGREPAIVAMRRASAQVQLKLRVVDAGLVGFVHRKNVSEFENRSLWRRSHLSSAGRQDENHYLRLAGDLDFSISRAHSLDKDNIRASSVQKHRQVRDFRNSRFHMPTRCNGPHENIRI